MHLPWVVACALVLLVSCVLSTPATARAAQGLQDGSAAGGGGQGQSGFTKPRPRLLSLQAGWRGTVLPGPPAPWRLALACGEEPVDATVTMSFQQDSTQNAEITQRVALVPGRISNIEFAAAITESGAEVQFVLRDSSGRRLDSVKAETWGIGNQQFQYVTPYYSFDSAVLFVGRRMNPPAASDKTSETNKERAEGYISGRCIFEIIEPTELPIDPASYGSVAAVVLDQTDLVRLDPLRLTALREYLATGGNVSLIVDAAGDGWQLLAGLLPITTQPSASAVLSTPTPVTLRDTTPVSATKLSALFARTKTPASLGAADTKILVRRCELTMMGRDEGWQVWPESNGEAVLARGPIGLGQLTLWLVSPSLLATSMELQAREDVWNAALLATGVAPPDENDPNLQRQWYSGQRESLRIASARRSTLAAMPPLSISHVMAWIFGVIMIVLALLVGVADVFMHRRDKRPRSYATCALWIVIACVLAAVLPGTLGNKAAFSLRIAETEQVAQSSAAPLARSYIAHTILADQPTRWAPPISGGFSQGFDLVEEYYGRRSGGLSLPTLEMATVAAPSGMTTRPIAPLNVRRSALHCIMEMQTGAPTIAAATTTDAEGNLLIRLAGLRPGDRVLLPALLFTNADVKAIDEVADAAGMATLRVTVPPAQGAPVDGGVALSKFASVRLLTVPTLDPTRTAQLARAASGRYVILQFNIRLVTAKDGTHTTDPKKLDGATSVEQTVATLHVPISGWPESAAKGLARQVQAVIAAEKSGVSEWINREVPAAAAAPGAAARRNQSQRLPTNGVPIPPPPPPPTPTPRPIAEPDPAADPDQPLTQPADPKPAAAERVIPEAAESSSLPEPQDTTRD